MAENIAVEMTDRDEKPRDLAKKDDPDKDPKEVSIESEERETWGHKAEFILATIGLAVGLGNVWRFPYLCQKNGGGAFLVPYIIFMLIEGLPLFFLELSIGQRMRKSAINCWRDIHPCLFGIGVACLMVSLMLCLYYIVIIAWCCYFFFISFTSDLPWKKQLLCQNWEAYDNIKSQMNTIQSAGNATANNTLYQGLKAKFDSFPDCCVRDPSAYYFYHHALEVSTSIEDTGVGINVKLAGCLVFAWILTYLCVVKGIKSSGKVVYFTATFPYIILIILFFRGVTLEGAGNGIKTLFTPDWGLLLDANIWKDAATQMFFTLSLGFGALIAFASYMPMHNQVMKDGYTVVLVNCGTSLFAGIVVFSILGYREAKTGIPVTEVGSGPGLAFITFSDAMLLMDVSPLWAILFFMMLILLGIDSEFGTLEAAIGPIMELNLFPKVRKELVTLGVAVILLLLGLCMTSGAGYYIFQMFDDYSVTIPLLVIALFQCIGVAWVYGNDRFADDIQFMTGKRPWVGWMICWKYISPIALLVVLIALVAQQSQVSPKYNKFVGCKEKPFGVSAGSDNWLEPTEYPGWGVFLIVVIVLVSTLPVLIWLIKDWPKNWRQGFHKMLCTGYKNYLPDPPKDENDKNHQKI
ncbi:sodium- and chloride-dependent GABA transporter 1 isoform X2 [Nematostella vectensis]|uniref:sodium- and chloride-dependent GABA transporter 1 isoform X2 n=1 Tax=Nematostella vectensis TaxID=45351 RepID=UPI0013900E97|nr:sodium- and chloride-dependent GABA transporter 1 isoform X2 [Nematostella vectensis]